MKPDGIVPGVRDDLAPGPQGLPVAHHNLGNPVLLLAQECRVDERHHQLQQGRVALLPSTLPLRVAPGIYQQQTRPSGLQRPRAHVVHPVMPPLLEPDQAKVLCAIRERLALPAVVADMVQEEEVGHVIVTTAKKVVEARSATMV